MCGTMMRATGRSGRGRIFKNEMNDRHGSRRLARYSHYGLVEPRSKTRLQELADMTGIQPGEQACRAAP